MNVSSLKWLSVNKYALKLISIQSPVRILIINDQCRHRHHHYRRHRSLLLYASRTFSWKSDTLNN